jgi:hypothetical protein
MPQLDSFATSDFLRLPPAIVEAIEAAPMPDLGDGPQVPALFDLLSDGLKNQWTSIDSSQQSLCISGLWLLAGELDRSHSISQDIGSAEGSFWHAIMHRREGDFGNSKYWFRRVGSHPVFDQLAEISDGVYSDPYDFVDQCSRVQQGDDESSQECQRAQWLEWQALMSHCIRM